MLRHHLGLDLRRPRRERRELPLRELSPSSPLSARLELGAGRWRVAVKECIDVAGLVTRCGSPALEDRAPAAEHAQVVARLLAGDFRLVGHAHMHELAFGLSGINPHCGTPGNPRWPDRIVGGSSSGSAAAVASGACDVALGTDAGGSIRLPATCCGVVGLKPSFGRLSRQGVHPGQGSLSCVGPIAATVEGVVAAMAAMDPTFEEVAAPTAVELGRVRVTGLAPTVAEATRGEGTEVELDLDEAYDAARAALRHEVYEAFAELVRSSPEVSEQLRRRVLSGATIDADTLRAAEATRRRFRAEVDALLEDFDALLLPALPSIPPLVAAARDTSALVPLSRLLRPFNLSGHPAITLPVETAEGMPAGIQLVGRRGEDAALCAVAQRIERG